MQTLLWYGCSSSAINSFLDPNFSYRRIFISYIRLRDSTLLVPCTVLFLYILIFTYGHILTSHASGAECCEVSTQIINTAPRVPERKLYRWGTNAVWHMKYADSQRDVFFLYPSSSHFLQYHVRIYRLQLIILILKTLALNIPSFFPPTTCYTF
jgi:hypothetical protein